MSRRTPPVIDRAEYTMVLAPLSVTAEQVALITDPRYPDGRAFGPVFTDSVHEAFRRGVDTALAAMGIPVVES